MSAHVNSDGGGERIVSSKEDWSISSPGEDGDHHRPDGENDAKCYENAVVCDEAGDPNSGKKSIAKAKRMRIFFRKKLRSESEANVKLFSAKRSEANSLRFRSFSQFCEKCENLKENFAYKNCVKFFAYFSFALFLTVFLKIGTRRISLIKK